MADPSRLASTTRTATLAARGLGRAFGDITAVDGVDLQVLPGEIHALVGLNGAGKTTLMRLLLGMVHADCGTATVHGHEVAACTPDDWARVGHLIETPFAAALFQDHALYEKWMERVPLGRHGQPGDLIGTLLYLASDASAYVTGQILVVDGGGH